MHPPPLHSFPVQDQGGNIITKSGRSKLRCDLVEADGCAIVFTQPQS